MDEFLVYVFKRKHNGRNKRFYLVSSYSIEDAWEDLSFKLCWNMKTTKREFELIKVMKECDIVKL